MHTAERKILMLKPSDIFVPAGNTRKSFDEYELKLLADSISSIGIIQPLTVRKNIKGMYELISGERRLRAAKLAGMRRVPCIIHKTDIAGSALLAATENIQKCGLHFFEEADALEKLTSEHGISQTEISVRLGISQAALCNRIRLLRIDPSLRGVIIEKNISERHCLLLLRLPDNLREEALYKIINDSLTLSQAEQYINGLLCPVEDENIKPLDDETPLFESSGSNTVSREEPVRKAAIGDMRLFENSLEKLVDKMRDIGIDAGTYRRETERYIEYRVRVKKDVAAASAKQLRIC